MQLTYNQVGLWLQVPDHKPTKSPGKLSKLYGSWHCFNSLMHTTQLKNKYAKALEGVPSSRASSSEKTFNFPSAGNFIFK